MLCEQSHGVVNTPPLRMLQSIERVTIQHDRRTATSRQLKSELLLVTGPALRLIPHQQLLLLCLPGIDGQLNFICCALIWRAGPAVCLQRPRQLLRSSSIAGVVQHLAAAARADVQAGIVCSRPFSAVGTWGATNRAGGNCVAHTPQKVTADATASFKAGEALLKWRQPAVVSAHLSDGICHLLPLEGVVAVLAYCGTVGQHDCHALRRQLVQVPLLCMRQ